MPDFGKLSSAKTLLVGAAVLGGMGLMSSTPKSSKNPNKALAEKISRVLDNPNIRVAQTRSASNRGQEVNKNDGNPFGSTTTYHSYTWDLCEEWRDAETCQKWLDPYVSQHGFGSEKSVLEGKVSSLYEGMRDKKNQNEWAIWNIQAKNGQSVQDEQGRLNRKALSKFELKDEVKEELAKVGEEAAREIMVEAVDKDESKQTMPNMESLRAIAGSLTLAYRNNLVGLLGGVWRNTVGIEIPGGVNYTDCNIITSAQNEEETQEKLLDQGPLDDKTFDTDLQKRVELCRQLMSQSVRTVNPQVSGDSLVSADPNQEQIDQWRLRANIELIDNPYKDASSITKPADANLTKEEVGSAVVLSDNGNEQTVYETPKKQLEEYNEMLKKAAESYKQLAKETQNHINPELERIILSHQIKKDNAPNLVKINLAKKAGRDLSGEQVTNIPTNQLEMTPQKLIETASQ